MEAPKIKGPHLATAQETREHFLKTPGHSSEEAKAQVERLKAAAAIPDPESPAEAAIRRLHSMPATAASTEAPNPQRPHLLTAQESRDSLRKQPTRSSAERTAQVERLKAAAAIPEVESPAERAIRHS